jgi:hypothetical protein
MSEFVTIDPMPRSLSNFHEAESMGLYEMGSSGDSRQNLTETPKNFQQDEGMRKRYAAMCL